MMKLESIAEQSRKDVNSTADTESWSNGVWLWNTRRYGEDSDPTLRLQAGDKTSWTITLASSTTHRLEPPHHGDSPHTRSWRDAVDGVNMLVHTRPQTTLPAF